MQNLLTNYNQPLTKTDESSHFDVIDIRNLNYSSKSLTLEFDSSGDVVLIPFPDKNNDSVLSFPRAFSVCLQGLDLDCESGYVSTSQISIDTTKNYKLYANGVTTILKGDALLDYIRSLPGVVVDEL